MNEFKDKVIIVTGGSAGIGRATVKCFADDGAKVVIADVLSAQGEDLAQSINAAGGSALFVKCDVAKEEDVINVVEAAVKKFGRIDYAFNNAGVEGQPAPTDECSNENWERTINVNLRGVWWCMKYEIRQMLKQGGGSIVNCSSIAGMVGLEGIPAYVASKHAVIGLTKTAALENAKKRIRVNAVCPGVIRTAMIDRFTKGESQAMNALTEDEPVGRLGKPEEIASAVKWLCSEGSAFVTGHALVVDGGWTAK